MISESCLLVAQSDLLLMIVGGRIVGFIPFQRMIAFYEMKTALFKIWAQVDVSIPMTIISTSQVFPYIKEIM